MGELRRGSVSALSVGLTCATFQLVWGTRLPGSGVLHKWYWGFVTFFVAVLIAMMTAALRGRLERSAWPIIVGALLGYSAASLAYLIYFEMFELELLANSMRRLGVLSVIGAAMVLAPSATLSTLFGALSGALFVMSRYLVLRYLPREGTVLNEWEQALEDAHGLSPYINVETFIPRNAQPSDKMLQQENIHNFPEQ